MVLRCDGVAFLAKAHFCDGPSTSVMVLALLWWFAAVMRGITSQGGHGNEYNGNAHVHFHFSCTFSFFKVDMEMHGNEKWKCTCACVTYVAACARVTCVYACVTYVPSLYAHGWYMCLPCMCMYDICAYPVCACVHVWQLCLIARTHTHTHTHTHKHRVTHTHTWPI